MREVGERHAVVPAMILVFLVAAIIASGQMATLLGRSRAVASAGSDAFGDQAGALLAAEASGILVSLIWGPVLWTLAAGALYGVAYLLGGRGSFMALWPATGFALAPQLLVAPFSPALEAAASLGPTWQLILLMFSIPSSILAFVWTIILLGVAVSATMGLSAGRAVASIGILFFGTILLGALLLLMFILGMAVVVVAAT
jgi:hypothetical protein